MPPAAASPRDRELHRRRLGRRQAWKRAEPQHIASRNPLHYDERAAKASRHGEIVVQGGITSSILNAVVAEDLPGPGTVFLHVDWKFKAPVRPGDTITGRVVAFKGTAVCYTMAV